MAELLGTHSYQLDPKGRVSLPAKFRAAFVDGCWITVGQDHCLYVFPRAEWERRSDEVASSPLSDRDGRAYSRMFFASSDESRLDGQGRGQRGTFMADTTSMRRGLWERTDEHAGECRRTGKSYESQASRERERPE